ncbi:hypothetical protein, partial [Paraburkholderia humisilvae]|uniref:hypothetical protein n=1 Tax=Paraburkholderia humisilvae TaxID=627669 RepID=UPI0035E4C91D
RVWGTMLAHFRHLLLKRIGVRFSGSISTGAHFGHAIKEWVAENRKGLCSISPLTVRDWLAFEEARMRDEADAAEPSANRKIDALDTGVFHAVRVTNSNGHPG